MAHGLSLLLQGKFAESIFQFKILQTSRNELMMIDHENRKEEDDKCMEPKEICMQNTITGALKKALVLYKITIFARRQHFYILLLRRPSAHMKANTNMTHMPNAL